ncbi:MAG TPA: hypothetical protein VM049_01145 [Gaiellaceae bacterium]|nr:hypothetical protein [Gaiellaceae bacterium]
MAERQAQSVAGEDFGWTDLSRAATPAEKPKDRTREHDSAPSKRDATELVFAASCVLVQFVWLALLAYLFVRFEVFQVLITRAPSS